MSLCLLEGDNGAGVLEVLLGGLAILLARALLEDLGRRLDNLLGLLEAQAGDGANNLRYESQGKGVHEQHGWGHFATLWEAA